MSNPNPPSPGWADSASSAQSPAPLTSAALLAMYQRTFTLLHAYDEGQLPNQTEVAETLAKLHNQAIPK